MMNYFKTEIKLFVLIKRNSFFEPDSIVSFEGDDNGLRLRGRVHQGQNGLGAHPATQNSVEGWGGSSPLNVTQNCDPGVLKYEKFDVLY